MTRVVVIGAGMSGLAVAARLARLRHEVTVLEATAGPGGQCGRYERDGFAFDTGPTLLHLPATYRDLFVKTGKTAPLESVLELTPIEPAVRWQFADGTVVDLPNASRAGTVEALTEAFGAAEAAGWDELIAAGMDVWATFRHGFNAPTPARLRDAIRSSAGRARLRALRPARSLRALGRRHLHDSRLRVALESYPARMGTDPARAPALHAIWPAMEHAFGAWRPRGGVAALVDVLADRAILRGAQIRYDAVAERVVVAGGAVRAVRLRDGEQIEADVVVTAVDRATADGLLGRSTPARASTPANHTLLLALRDEDDLPPTTVLPADRTAPTLWLDRGRAPAGVSAWVVHASSGGRSAPDVLGELDRRGYRATDRLLWTHRVPPTAGVALPGLRALLRPPNATGVRGLHQVGAWTQPGPGIDLVPLAAALVAAAVGRAH